MANNNKLRRKSRYNKHRRMENAPECPLCQKPVRDLYSAITYKNTNEPAHFDCILKVLREAHGLKENEKICYLGNGSFGIIQFRNTAGRLRFFIRERIHYEETDPVPEWRKKLF